MANEYLMPPEWGAAGAHFGRDGLLYLAEWRRGFTVHELRAMFFDCQQVRTLERERRQAVTDLERVSLELSRLETLVAWYHKQLVLESRWAAMLARITI